jgi:hypothetical protein
VGDAVEVFADIQFQEEGITTREAPSPLEGGNAPLILATGERVGDQPALEDRLAQIHDRVVQQLFGVEDRELVVNPQGKVASEQGRPHPIEVVVQPGDKRPHVTLRPLADQRLVNREPQIVAVDDPLK